MESRNVKGNLIVGAIVLVSVMIAFGYGGVLYSAVKSTTPEGREHTLSVLKYNDRMELRKHEKEMKELDIKQARISARKVPTEALTTPAPSHGVDAASCDTPGIGKGMARAESLHASAGSCVSFQGTDNAPYFWLKLVSQARKTSGVAGFSRMREETEEDRNVRYQHCISRRNDIDACGAELRQRVMVRIDQCLIGTYDQNHCVDWLNSHIGETIVVAAAVGNTVRIDF